MRLAFLGTAEFGLPTLQALLASPEHDVVGVVTGPDKPAGRGRRLRPTPVADHLEKNGYAGPVFKPEKLKDPGFARRFAALELDAAVVVAFRILPRQVFDAPRLGTLNVHPSDLPRYRGPAPLNWTIINGDEQTRVSLIRITERVDAGGVVARSEPIPVHGRETAGELHDRLAPVGAALVLETLARLEAGEELPPRPQDEAKATKAPKLSKEDGRIDWRRDPAQVHNRVRGLTPWPGAFTTLPDGRKLKLFDSLPVDPEAGEPPARCGQVLGLDHPGAPDRMTVAAGSGAVSFGEVQLEGKKRMPASEFLKGLRLQDMDSRPGPLFLGREHG